MCCYSHSEVGGSLAVKLLWKAGDTMRLCARLDYRGRRSSAVTSVA